MCVYVRACMCESEKKREIRVCLRCAVHVRVCEGGDAVFEWAICEHVYAPLSLNLYMFE